MAMADYGFTPEQQANFVAAKGAHEAIRRLLIERALKLAQLRAELSEEEYQVVLAVEGIKNV